MNRLDILQLPKGRRLLVAGALVEASGAESFTAPEAIGKLMNLKIPPPANPHQTLSRLADEELILDMGQHRWAVTPSGQAELATEMGFKVDLDLVSGQPSTKTELIQPGPVQPPFAPPWLQEGVDSLLKVSDFDRSIFVMMPFRDDAVHQAVEQAVRDELDQHGLIARLAKDGNVVDGLWENVCCYMWASRYGIAVFDHITEEVHNPNVAIEVGYMLAIGRRCLLLKEASVEKLPTDIVGRVYRAFDAGNAHSTTRGTVAAWIQDDLKYEGA